MTAGRERWDTRFLRLAEREVADWSKDPEEGVGCVIVSPDRRRQALGYNGFPRGVADTPERLESKWVKNMLTVHAELNAILNARTDLTGWTLYATKAPCVECAKAIIQVEIARVVCPPIQPSSRWSADQVIAQDLMLEAGILVSSSTEEGEV